MGANLLHEYIMYSYDVPLSKHFMPTAMTLFAERFRNVLRRQDEFDMLGPTQQKRALETCVFHAVAITVTKLEACEGFWQQLKFVVGSGQDRSYVTDVLDFDGFAASGESSGAREDATPRRRKMKKLRMADANKTTTVLDPETMQRFGFLIGSLGALLRDNETLMLLVLMMLFDGGVGDGDVTCMAIQQKYLTILRRRLKHQHGQRKRSLFDFEEDSDDEPLANWERRESSEEEFDRFLAGLAHVKELSKIVLAISGPPPQQRGEGESGRQ